MALLGRWLPAHRVDVRSNLLFVRVDLADLDATLRLFRPVLAQPLDAHFDLLDLCRDLVRYALPATLLRPADVLPL